MGMIQDLQKTDKERRHEVATMLSEADVFVKDLAKGSAQRRNDVETMLNEFAKEGAERRSEVCNMRTGVATILKEFAKQDAERRSEVATMRGEVATMLRDLAVQTQQRKAEVTAIVEEADTFVKDLAKGDAERRSEVATIHEMVWGKAPAKKMVAPAVEELPKEMPPGKPVVAEAPLGEFRDRVFAYLANHPDGTKLTELEGEFDMARIQIAKVVRALVDDNKVEKRDLLYFAI